MLRVLLRLVGWSGLVALAAGLSITTASAKEDVVGHVYVNDNTAGANTIAGFDRHSDGSLTPIEGSPFNAGGQGTGTIVGSQGSLQASGDGRYLLVADAGSNQISVLRILPDGALRRVGRRPVSSGGVEPISIAVHENLGDSDWQEPRNLHVGFLELRLRHFEHLPQQIRKLCRFKPHVHRA